MSASANSLTARHTFALNMRRRRIAAGLSQESLAALCGLHRTYIGSVERAERNVSIDNMERIARALKSALSDLTSEGASRHASR